MVIHFIIILLIISPYSFFNSLDMQWADMSTIRLLESMQQNTTMKSLLLVCAYRDNEVNESHPFRAFLDEASGKGKKFLQIALTELNTDCIAKMLADAFHCSFDKVAPFAELVCTIICISFSIKND